MDVFVLSVFMICVAATTAEVLPLLNEGEVRVANVTDTSVVLAWTKHEWNGINETSLSVPLRLMISIETWGKPPVYIIANHDDRHCSIEISKCQITVLTHDTRYKITVTIDDTKHLFGYATSRFTTLPLPTYNPGPLTNKVLLYVVLPAIGGVIFILIILLIVCAKCCHCCCWRQKVQVITVSHPQEENRMVQMPQTNDADDALYDEAYDTSESIANNQTNGRYFPFMSGQDPTPRSPQRFDMARHHSSSSASSRQTHFQTQLSLDEIMAQRNQLHQQHHNRQQPPLHQMKFNRPPAEPPLDDDGYLYVVDQPSLSDHYANASQTQLFKML